ncbi:MAG: CDP-diacylglycerol--glycerol-3-phosphate 3-phosphatidyltransferase [Leptospiraceae bacterium]|nr:CDP-diacylglycerol--glycerol-3-phosphate 3-phosphatidyltransferase [Leptospiraceae bacterium]MCK6379768.1 CDP-diacylglycerol--glycerol-3-phosphate 3-phosphatidyltransferase [Leptospiraceae bacterium]NUM41228.1 CDP-diacylglycerol--glycerol-3-phosphate 3-phosphatidyltransferase [Leptospiraceae bacterium]
MKFEKELNFPNILTVVRVLIVPFFIYFLFQDGLVYRVTAFLFFVLASLTDLIDGYLARKWNQETEFGKFLDPLADKILVIGSFITFILLDEQIELWMVLLIIFRDMLITTLRFLAIRLNKSLRTTMMGKVKTTFQMTAILLLLIFFMLLSIRERNAINLIFENGRASGLTVFEIANDNFFNLYNTLSSGIQLSISQCIFQIATFVPYYAMLFTTFITVLSGLRYLVTNLELLKLQNLLQVLFRKK